MGLEPWAARVLLILRVAGVVRGVVELAACVGKARGHTSASGGGPGMEAKGDLAHWWAQPFAWKPALCIAGEGECEVGVKSGAGTIWAAPVASVGHNSMAGST